MKNLKKWKKMKEEEERNVDESIDVEKHLFFLRFEETPPPGKHTLWVQVSE